MESVTKPSEPSSINIVVVFVASTVYLVEVAKGKPFDTERRLEAQEFEEEIFFQSSVGRTVDNGDLEGVIITLESNRFRLGERMHIKV